MRLHLAPLGGDEARAISAPLPILQIADRIGVQLARRCDVAMLHERRGGALQSAHLIDALLGGGVIRGGGVAELRGLPREELDLVSEARVLLRRRRQWVARRVVELRVCPRAYKRGALAPLERRGGGVEQPIDPQLAQSEAQRLRGVPLSHVRAGRVRRVCHLHNRARRRPAYLCDAWSLPVLEHVLIAADVFALAAVDEGARPRVAWAGRLRSHLFLLGWLERRHHVLLLLLPALAHLLLEGARSPLLLLDRVVHCLEAARHPFVDAWRCRRRERERAAAGRDRGVGQVLGATMMFGKLGIYCSPW